MGFVYFIHAPQVELVKIGFSESDPVLRFNTIQPYSPVPLVKWAILRGTIELEGKIHEHLRTSRSHNEWFRVTKKVRRFVERYGSPWTKYLYEVPEQPMIELDTHTRLPGTRSSMAFLVRDLKAKQRKERQDELDASLYRFALSVRPNPETMTIDERLAMQSHRRVAVIEGVLPNQTVGFYWADANGKLTPYEPTPQLFLDPTRDWLCRMGWEILEPRCPRTGRRNAWQGI